MRKKTLLAALIVAAGAASAAQAQLQQGTAYFAVPGSFTPVTSILVTPGETRVFDAIFGINQPGWFNYLGALPEVTGGITWQFTPTSPFVGGPIPFSAFASSGQFSGQTIYGQLSLTFPQNFTAGEFGLGINLSNPTTGASGNCLSEFAQQRIQATVVPAPGALAPFAGLGLLAVRRKRRRSAAD